MRVAGKLRLRLRSLLHRDRVERELSAEMQFHLDQQIEENLAAGMTAAEARRSALATIGSVTHFEEECRDARGVNFVDNLVRDLRYAARALMKNRGFAAVAVMSIALGIGATTAIFSVVDAVMLKTLPVESPERLVAVDIITTQGNTNNFSYPMFEAVRRRVPAFAGVFAALDGTSREQLSRPGGNRVGEVQYLLVSGEYFDVLGVRPFIGRVLAPEDNVGVGAHPVAVISHRFWKTAFQGDPGVIGSSVVLRQQALTIVGIAPPEFFGEAIGRAADLWVPLMMQPVLDRGSSYLDRANTGWLRVMARLRPGVTEANARAAMAVFLAQLKSEPGELAQFVREVREMTPSPGARGLDDLRRRYSQPLRALFLTAGMILLLACVNVANLLLARGAARHREIAVRLAIGAKRSRVIRQLMTENTLIALLGGGLGVAVAAWATRGLLLLVSGGPQAVHLDAGVDRRMLLFTAAASLLSSALFGLLPALRATRADASLIVTNTARRGQTLARALVVVQIAVSVLLVAGAGLFVQTLRNLRSRDLGFRPERLVQAQLDTRASGYPREQLPALYERLTASVGALPGVLSVSMSTQGFTTGISRTCCLAVAGHTFRSQEERRIRTRGVAAGYFETVRLPILEGRAFTAADLKRNVAIISRTMAQQFFPGESPVGKRFGWGDPPKVEYRTEIVGVAEDANPGNLREEARPMIYTPSPGGDSMHVRTAMDAAAAVGAVRQAIQRVDPNLWTDVQSIDTIIDRVLITEKVMATLGSCFGVLALLLAGVGLYGVTTYSVERRTREIGLRMALGANRAQVVRMISREVAMLATLGLALGIPLTLLLERVSQNLLFGTRAADPSLLLLVIGTLTGVSILATLRPSRRAASVDPMRALRTD